MQQHSELIDIKNIQALEREIKQLLNAKLSVPHLIMKHLLTVLAFYTASPSTTIDPITLTNHPNPSITKTVETPVLDFSVIKFDHARRYVKEIYPIAKKIEAKRGMPFEITVGIACLESGYGSSGFAKHRNNHLGIRKYTNGIAGYRYFTSLEECFSYYDKMFDFKRYSPLQEIEGDDLREWLTILCKCGYNHRDSYIEKVLYLINYIGIDQIEVVNS